MRVLLAFVLLFSGCDLILNNEDGCLIEAQGRTISPGTGEPVVGLGVSLQESSIVSPVVAKSRTGQDGQFLITYDARRPAGTNAITEGYTLTINDEPYDPRYTVRVSSIFEGGECSVDLGDVEIGPNPNMP